METSYGLRQSLIVLGQSAEARGPGKGTILQMEIARQNRTVNLSSRHTP